VQKKRLSVLLIVHTMRLRERIPDVLSTCVLGGG